MTTSASLPLSFFYGIIVSIGGWWGHNDQWGLRVLTHVKAGRLRLLTNPCPHQPLIFINNFNKMNTPKIWAYSLAGLVAILNLLQATVGFIPQPWSGLVLAILSVATFYKIIQSHTPTILAGAGYVKR